MLCLHSSVVILNSVVTIILYCDLKKTIKDKDSVEVFYAETAIPGIYKWQV